MMKKSIALLVSLMLVVLGFTTAAASDTETVTTITCKPGVQLGDLGEAGKLLESAAMRIHYMPEEYGAIVLTLNGVDTLDGLFRITEDGAYVQSALLGTRPLYFSWEDMMATVMEYMESSEDFEDMYGSFNPEMLQAMMDGSMTDEEMASMMGMDPALDEYMNDIAASQQVETGAFTISGSDVASQKTVTVLTNEDLVRAVELPMVRESLMSQMQMEAMYMDEDEIAEEVDEEIAEMKQAIIESNISITITELANDDDPIAMEIVVSGYQDDAMLAATEGAKLTVTKTTIGEARFYQMHGILFVGAETLEPLYASMYVDSGFATGELILKAEEDVPALIATFNCDSSQDNHVVGDIVVTAFEEFSDSEISLLIAFDQRKDGEMTDTVFNVFTGGAIDDIKANLAKYDLITLNIHTVTQPNSGFFAGLENATPDTAAQLLTMSENELEVYMVSMQQSMMMTILTLIENLPPELSEQLMQSMSGF